MTLKEQSKLFCYKLKGRFSLYTKRLLEYFPKSFYNRVPRNAVFSRAAIVEKLTRMLGTIDSETVLCIDDKTKQDILFLANQTLEYRFNILGSGWVTNAPISWSIDLNTRQEWPQNLFYLKQRGVTPEGADIKMPWELSRGHYLLWLGEAYIFTEEEKYANKIVSLIEDWIDNNPLMYTVNWTCSMDVAIRAVNWMYAVWMISRSESLTDSFAKKVCKSLYQHGYYICHNLEKSYPWSNNHYTSDLVGLIYISTLFNHISKEKKWQQRTINEFYEETRRQILPSGVHYEKSISYHRLVVELTCYPLSMLIRMGEHIPDDIINITQKMYDYVGAYIKPNGMAPLLADNDDGRFLPFTYGNFLDHRYLLDNDGIDRKIIDNGIDSPFKLHYSSQSKIYGDAGIAIIKKHDAYLLVNNSGYSKHEDPNKKHIGTHTHNDQLSFELSIGKDDIIIDPGTFVYTSSINARNEFRSTKKHNTLMVDGEEQNLLSETSAFSMTKNNKDRRIDVNDNVITGSYETINGGLSQERTFVLTEGLLEITDRLKKDGAGHRGKMFFHLSEKIKDATKEGDSVHVELPSYAVIIRCTAQNIKEKITTQIVDDTYSPSYGILKPAKSLVVDFDFDDRCTIKTIIEWKKK